LLWSEKKEEEKQMTNTGPHTFAASVGRLPSEPKFIESCKGLSQKLELQRIRRPADVRKMIRRKKTKLEEGTPFLS
jgi:hypothetical protein